MADVIRKHQDPRTAQLHHKMQHAVPSPRGTVAVVLTNFVRKITRMLAWSNEYAVYEIADIPLEMNDPSVLNLLRCRMSEQGGEPQI